MTEIERELLSALEHLQSEQNSRAESLRSELETQQKAFSLTVTALLKRLESLSKQNEQQNEAITCLSKQNERQSEIITSLSTQIESLSGAVAILRKKLRI